MQAQSCTVHSASTVRVRATHSSHQSEHQSLIVRLHHVCSLQHSERSTHKGGSSTRTSEAERRSAARRRGAREGGAGLPLCCAPMHVPMSCLCVCCVRGCCFAPLRCVCVCASAPRRPLLAAACISACASLRSRSRSSNKQRGMERSAASDTCREKSAERTEKKSRARTTHWRPAPVPARRAWCPTVPCCALVRRPCPSAVRCVLPCPLFACMHAGGASMERRRTALVTCDRAVSVCTKTKDERTEPPRSTTATTRDSSTTTNSNEGGEEELQGGRRRSAERGGCCVAVCVLAHSGSTGSTSALGYRLS